jgi:hypothetical protein
VALAPQWWLAYDGGAIGRSYDGARAELDLVEGRGGVLNPVERCGGGLDLWQI